ncbi:hypothetical protein [uncultured Bdellovibrio sp.]|uniref:hypothetical protein n=1 Tax=Bdellovibrio sp. HCB-162 TaxID=3394234 RepID=UPI0025F0DA4A|nr:hypothetical protein [uncultured Bdellovibrio sp.]
MVSLEQLPHPDFLPYPSHYTSAFFQSKEDAEKAISELESLGFNDDEFNIFEGDSGVHAVDIDGDHHNVIEKYMRKFIKMSDSAEWRFLSEADYELKNGHLLVCVPTLSDQKKQEVISAFKKADAYDIRYFTPLYVEEIE